MKTINTDKPYSWLQWSVELGGFSGEAHVTAKFFGRAKISAHAVEELLLTSVAKSRELRSHLFWWEPRVFGVDTPVLEFTTYPRELWDIHDLFKLIEDDFKPWRPHITVHQSYWERISETGASPLDEGLGFGELELYLGTGKDADT